jgi:hypothetical protein
VFLDPLSLTFPDPVIPLVESAVKLRLAVQSRDRSCLCPIASAEDRFGLLARGLRRGRRESNMKKALSGKVEDELRPEYDLSQLKGGVRGKYYRQALAGTNLVLIEPDLAKMFPDSAAVNRALRVVAEAAQILTAPGRRRARSR